MDDLKEKLSGILNDPESLEQLKNMAESIFSGDDSNSPQDDNIPPLENIGAIMGILSKLNGKEENDRTRLINSLKPYLSDSRKQKADNAIKLLKIIELWPLIKESGMLNF